MSNALLCFVLQIYIFFSLFQYLSAIFLSKRAGIFHFDRHIEHLSESASQERAMIGNISNILITLTMGKPSRKISQYLFIPINPLGVLFVYKTRISLR